MDYIKEILREADSAKRRGVLILMGIITGWMFVSFVYTDITETTRHGITFWNALSGGRLREFYIMNSNVVISDKFGTSIASIYDFPLYVVFAVWNFPLWIYEKLTGLYALDTMPGLLWAKSISIPFLVGTYVYAVKIGKKTRGDVFSPYTAILMMSSSVMYMMAVLVMGQYDALSLLFIMAGIYHYICGNENKFMLFFGIAMLFKMFAIFIYIPLILLKNKKVINVVVQTGLGCSLLILCKLLQNSYFYVDEVGKGYFGGHFINFIFQSQAGLAYGGASLFFAGFAILCMFCYFRRTPDEAEMGRWAIFVGFCALAVFFISSLTHPQWSLLLLPFSLLLVCCNDESGVKTGLWIDTIFSIGLLLAAFVYYFWVFNIKTSIYTLAGKLFYDGQKDINYSVRDYIASFMQGMDMGYVNLAAGGIFVAGVLFFIYWSYPDNDKKRFAELPMSVESVILLRLMVMVVTYILLVRLMA